MEQNNTQQGGCNMLNWDCKVQTGILLASINVLFFSLIFLKMSVISLLSYMVLGYLIYGAIRNRFVHQESQAQENNTCMADTIKSVEQMVTQFEEMIKRASSLDDIVFTAKVFSYFFPFNFFFSSLDSFMDLLLFPQFFQPLLF